METKGGFYISQIKQLQGRIFQRLLEQNGLSISGAQGRILFILWRQDHLTVSEISRQTSLAKNTVSIVVDGMVQKGILRRAENPLNRRQTIVSLSSHAKAMEETYETVTQEMNALFYAGFSAAEREQFEAYLARILHTLRQIEAPQSASEEEALE